ncbi:MAG: hypothetical protein ACOX9R_15590 [Armatimonadota bacterium]|jgi:hypothetical protein
MSPRMSFAFPLLVAVFFAAIVLGGCPSQETEIEAEVPPEAGLLIEDEAEGMQTGDGVADLGDFEWTETPTVEMAPSGPVRGQMSERAFEANLVQLRKDGEDKFYLRFSSAEPANDDPTMVIVGDDSWKLSFTAPEGETGTWTWALSDDKDFSEEHLFHYYAQGEGRGPMSVNAPWAAALEISEWSIEEPEEDAGTFHPILGTARGKVVLIMNDQNKSWCAGEFEAVYFE